MSEATLRRRDFEVNATNAKTGYLIALAALALATLLRWALSPLLGGELPLLTYYLAVLAVASVATLGPALAALCLGAAAAWAFFVPAPIGDRGMLLDFGRYFLVGGAAVLAIRGALHLAERHQSEDQRIRGALRASEEQFRAMIEQIRDYAIFLIDTEARATSWNEGVRRVLGFEESEFVGVDVSRVIFTPEDVERGVPERELAEAAESGTAGNDRWMQRKDGSRFFAIGVTVARRDAAGRLIGYAKIMRDQTERKLLEEALTDTARHLAEVNERQSRFLAMLSHELRNPLAPIRSAVEYLRLTGHAGTGEAGTAVEVIHRQVSQLVRLVDDLLDVNRIRSGKIELRKARVDLVESVSHAVEVARAQCGSVSEFAVDLPNGPLMVEADAARISQVVSNLLHNACKFTPQGGAVRLSLAREGDEAVVRVRDTGIGIPPAELTRIFGMFEQLDPANGAAQGGLGIGLSLSKSLVELHGGSIEAHSEGRDKGSEFIVRLPLAEMAPADAPRHEPAPAALPAKRKVLVVDDNPDAAESLATILRLGGHEAHCAHNGPEALEQAARRGPEIILLDIGLPLMNGYEVARRIRATPQGRKATLVAVTGWGQEEDIRRAREAGFDGHVTKPVDHGQLLEILRGQRITPRAG